MGQGAVTSGRARRLLWLDVLKGASILWIACFHLYQAATNGSALDPLQPDLLGRAAAQCDAASGLGTAIACYVRGLGGAFTLLGFHAVSVFLVLAGFGLARSLGDAGGPRGGWGRWYRRRLLRLFPMYWLAHLVLAVSPWTLLPEPIDYRFWISLTGLRLWPIEMIHVYFNPAWWYFTCLLQMYLAFPLLWWTERRLGPFGFAVAGLVASLVTRWWLLIAWPVTGAWSQGAFFMSRVAEFAFGMSVGVWHARDAERTETWIASPAAFGLGLAVYAAGLASYRSLWSYCATDALIGYGLTAAMAALAYRVAEWPGARVVAGVGVYSYGLYLFHQPYVLFAGERWRELGTLPYLGAAALLIATLAVLTRQLEIWVDRAMDRVA